MGSRSRKRGRVEQRPLPEASPDPSPAGPRERMERGYARGEARNAEIRAGIEPLAPGERPVPVLIAIGVTAVLCVVNLVLFLIGYEVDGKEAGPGALVVFDGLMIVMGVGMWRLAYSAVLGFQALLAITIIFASLGLLAAANLLAVALCLTTITLGGLLFWKMVRVLSRLDAPRRPEPRDV